MVKMVAQNLFKKRDSEDLKITTWYKTLCPDKMEILDTCTGQQKELGNKYMSRCCTKY